MIHLFSKLDHTVEKLGLYMSFLTGRYIVMGRMPDNAPKEQLEAIRRFTEEHSGGGLPSNITSRPRSVIMPPRRRAASLEVTVRGLDRRQVTYSTNSVVSGTALGQTVPAPSGLHATASLRPMAPPTDVPAASIQRLPPSQRPPRPARAGPPHWAIPLATSRHPVKRKKPWW